MTKKNKQQENIFTPSGHQVDKDLMKVPVKVSPSLQALIANQIDLLEMLEGKAAKNAVLIEQHRVEVLQVEEEIASAFSIYVQKREKSRAQRLIKKQLTEGEKIPGSSEGDDKHPVEEPAEGRPARFEGNTAVPFDIENEPGPATDNDYADKPALGGKRAKDLMTREDDRSLEYNMHFDIESANRGPGLPSSKYETGARPAPTKTTGVDVRRVALGASIKALQSFLGRQLNEEEIKSLENQVDLYLA